MLINQDRTEWMSVHPHCWLVALLWVSFQPLYANGLQWTHSSLGPGLLSSEFGNTTIKPYLGAPPFSGKFTIPVITPKFKFRYWSWNRGSKPPLHIAVHHHTSFGFLTTAWSATWSEAINKKHVIWKGSLSQPSGKLQGKRGAPDTLVFVGFLANSDL